MTKIFHQVNLANDLRVNCGHKTAFDRMKNFSGVGAERADVAIIKNGLVIEFYPEAMGGVIDDF